MKVEVYLSDTTLGAARAALKCIDESEGIRHIVIVPDRFSLFAEKLIFEALGKAATFNTEVMGFSGMCLSLLGREEFEDKILTSTDSLLLIREALNEVQLCAFTKCPTLALEIQKTIEQLKSSGIMPENVSYSGASKTLKNKIQDIQNVYFKYEELLFGRLDPGALLKLFDERVFSIPKVQDSRFYFVGFDSLTAAGFEILSKLSKCSLSVTVGAVLGNNHKNSYIYDGDLYSKIKKIAERDGLEILAKYEETELTPSVIHMKENLFGRKVDGLKLSHPYAFVTEANSREDEVIHLAKNIKFGVFNGARFKDYNVGLSNISCYEDIIERVFASFNIPYHIDAEKKLDQTVPARFILSVIKMFEERLSALEVFKVLEFPFLGFSENGINSLKKEVKEKGLFLIGTFDNDEDNARFRPFLNGQGRISKGDDFAKIVLEILENYRENILGYAESVGEEIGMQAGELISLALDKVEEVLIKISSFGEKFKPGELYDVLKLCFSAESVVSVPETSDCVFVGDMTASFFDERDFLYVLGASADELPYVMRDAGLISDKEILNLKDDFDLEPTIRMINGRNRFKLFNNLLFGKRELNILYTSVWEGKSVMPSQIVSDVKRMFLDLSGKCFPSLTTDKFEFYGQDADGLVKRFLFNLGTLANSRLALLRYKNSPNAAVAEMNEALSLVIGENERLDNEKIGSLAELSLAKKIARVTQLESFFKCPYAHFLSYGLKLKEQKEPKLDAGRYGSYMHRFAEGIVRGRSVRDILEHEILTDPSFVFLPKGSSELLMEDGLRLEADIKREMSVSKFRPVLIEEIFTESLKVIKGEETFNITGRVDRIDSDGGFFRIVDYKTGKKQNILKELYYGEKLQLFLYSAFAEKRLGLKSGGVFYFDANYSFANDDKEQILNGKYLKDEKLVKSLDFTLNGDNLESTVLNLKLKKKELVPTEVSGFKDGEALGWCVNYAKKMAAFALSEIVDGNIKKSPLQDGCKHCKFKNMCPADGEYRPTGDKVTEESFKAKLINDAEEGGIFGGI